MASYVKAQKLKLEVLPIAIPDAYVEHGSVTQLKKDLGLDYKSIVRRILER